MPRGGLVSDPVTGSVRSAPLRRPARPQRLDQRETLLHRKALTEKVNKNVHPSRDPYVCCIFGR